MPIIKLDDYKDENGNILWDTYDKAKIDAGQVCFQCKNLIINLDFPNEPRRCYSCKSLADAEEADHAKLIRCPYCQHTEDAENNLDGDRYGPCDEEVEATCSKCDSSYMVQVHVDISYTSPPLIQTKEEEEPFDIE